MKNKIINSGIIKSFEYDDQNQILFITGNDGLVYQYYKVPEKINESLNEAVNPSEYYFNHIRKKFKRLFKSYDYSGMI